MATVQTFNNFDCSTLAHFKNWAMAIGSALENLGWVQAADTSPAAQVDWANVVDVPANNVIRAANWSFDGDWTEGSPYTHGVDVVVYNPGSPPTGAVTYQCVLDNHGTLSNCLRQTAQTLSITSVDAHTGGQTVYNGSITGGASNAYRDWWFTILDCDNPQNNGSFICTASDTGTLTLQNANGVAEPSPSMSPTAVSSVNTVVYQYATTITGFQDADFEGQYFAFAGFANSGNNGSFECVWSGSGYQSVIVVNNASGVSEPSPSGTPSIICLTDPATSSAKTHPQWAPYYYEIWQTNDSLNATSPIFLRLVYYTQNPVLNGTGSSATPAILFSVGTRIVNGFISGNVLNAAASPVELLVQPGASAGASATYECDFSGSAGDFSMHMWRSVGANSTWTFVIDRGKNSGGTDIDTYFTVLSAQGSYAKYQQQIFKQSAGTRCPNAIDTFWETIDGAQSSYQQNGLVPALPIFPLIGYVGNPLFQAVAIPNGDVSVDGEQISVSVYGAPHTYMVSQNSTINANNNRCPAILWE